MASWSREKLEDIEEFAQEVINLLEKEEGFETNSFEIWKKLDPEDISIVTNNDHGYKVEEVWSMVGTMLYRRSKQG